MSAAVLPARISNRFFRLLELNQKLDMLLRLAQHRRVPDPFEISRIRARKQELGQRLAAFSVALMSRPVGTGRAGVV